jgi:hypothetical protein
MRDWCSALVSRTAVCEPVRNYAGFQPDNDKEDGAVGLPSSRLARRARNASAGNLRYGAWVMPLSRSLNTSFHAARWRPVTARRRAVNSAQQPPRVGVIAKGGGDAAEEIVDFGRTKLYSAKALVHHIRLLSKAA